MGATHPATTLARNDGVICPLGKKCKLEIVHRVAMLVECVLGEPGPCPKAFNFGESQFCGALMKPPTK
jgi:hypothetical protein